jgi:hypothetical protein
MGQPAAADQQVQGEEHHRRRGDDAEIIQIFDSLAVGRKRICVWHVEGSSFPIRFFHYTFAKKQSKQK